MQAWPGRGKKEKNEQNKSTKVYQPSAVYATNHMQHFLVGNRELKLDRECFCQQNLPNQAAQVMRIPGHICSIPRRKGDHHLQYENANHYSRIIV
ncbi:hypothetical protein TSUD_163380 [Trifolium subterraneum]|uniref:Uncharacterized protein n=1 Tax=Trifolium subterraneum TaxID=3900 RepID=A0A2Z6N2G8_TRISU|nr:hypothetical protein TSUD_163380 [Trifolium subterraneum]